MSLPYVTVIADPNDKYKKTRLVTASRQGCVIDHEPMNARRGDWDAARSEAQAKHPDKVVVIPDLGERPPARTEKETP